MLFTPINNMGEKEIKYVLLNDSLVIIRSLFELRGLGFISLDACVQISKTTQILVLFFNHVLAPKRIFREIIKHCNH